jgi:lambda family phage portal protein
MNGAKIPVFAPGTHLKIQNPGAASPVGASFEQSLLRHIAASLGVGYEQLSKDYSQANYSSTRASMSETWRSMQARKKMVADKYANFVYRLWMEEIVNANGLESLKRRNVPNFYDGLNGEAYTACDWIGAGQGLIEPLKETQADILALKAGLTTKDTVIARRTGADWRAVSKQIARELANDKNLDLPSVYEQDTQDMENSLTASPQEANP